MALDQKILDDAVLANLYPRFADLGGECRNVAVRFVVAAPQVKDPILVVFEPQVGEARLELSATQNLEPGTAPSVHVVQLGGGFELLGVV